MRFDEKEVEEWMSGHRRSVECSMSNYSGETEYKIFHYDYDLKIGKHISNTADLPSEDEMKEMQQEKVKALLKELESNN